MTEFLEKKQNNNSILVENFIDLNPEDQNRSPCLNINPSNENSNLINSNFIRELRPFKCNFNGCNKDYSNKSRLEIHLRTHTGDKPFCCEKCGRSFNEKGNLKIHYRIHTGEKPYKCSYQGCNKEFKAYGHLSDHLKRHFNIRPFKCDICNSCFSRRNTLKTHIMTHTGEKPHKCSFPGCNKRFSEKGNMKTHLKTHNRNNKKKFPYSESNEIDENLALTFAGNAGLRYEKDYLENSQVQKCYEYFYIGSKTTSSTTVLPTSPKIHKCDEESKINISKTEDINFQNDNIVIDDETEICATPNPNNGVNPLNTNMNWEVTSIPCNNNTNNNDVHFTYNNYNNLNNSQINLINQNSNKISNCNYSKENLSFSNCTNTSKKNIINKENFSEKLNNLLINSNSNGNSSESQQGVFGNNNSNNPYFNYGKYHEAQKISQLNSGNNYDSPSNNNISTSCSPLSTINGAAILENKPVFYNNLNMIFNEEYFPRNNFKNNYGEYLGDEDFNFNYKNTGFMGTNYNGDYLSLDNYFD